jgi:hypothetical protein
MARTLWYTERFSMVGSVGHLRMKFKSPKFYSNVYIFEVMQSYNNVEQHRRVEVNTS